MPRARDAQSPFRVHGSLRIDDHFDVSGAADGGEPFFGGGLGAVRDSDEVYGVGVLEGQGAEGEEGFFCD